MHKREILLKYFDRNDLDFIEEFSSYEDLNKAMDEYAESFNIKFLEFITDNYYVNYHDSVTKTWRDKHGIYYTPQELYNEFKKTITL